MANSPFAALPDWKLQELVKSIPTTNDQAHCREIYNALYLKGSMQLMQLCVVVSGQNLKSTHCKRLLKALCRCGLIEKERGKKTYKALWK